MNRSAINHTQWSDRLAFDVALTLEGSGEPLAEIIKAHSITSHDIIRFNADPVFLQRVDTYRSEIRDKGMTFKLKARAQAEELLTTSWMLIHDPAVSAAVKADLIKSTVKWAGLEPKNDEATVATGGVKITINLGDNDRDQRVIDLNDGSDDTEESAQLVYEQA